MKIIQSFWSTPYLQNNSKNKEYNWYDKKIFLYSQAISLNRLVKLGYEVEFYTDTYGQKLFGEYLNLPFHKIYAILDDDTDNTLWTKGKIKTYSVQTEPFVHIDSDVLLGKKLDIPNITNYIYGQSYYCRDKIKEKLKNTDNLPEFMILPEYMSEKNKNSICMGIFATDNLNLIKEHAELYFKYEKEWVVKDENKVYRNTILEEYLITLLASKHNVSIKYMFDLDSTKQRTLFQNLSKIENYIHIGGMKMHKNSFFNEMKKLIYLENKDLYTKIENWKP